MWGRDSGMRSGEQRGQDGGESALRETPLLPGPRSGVLGRGLEGKSWVAGIQAKSGKPDSGLDCGLGQPGGPGTVGPTFEKGHLPAEDRVRCQERDSIPKREAGLMWNFPAPCSFLERTALPGSVRGGQE